MPTAIEYATVTHFHAQHGSVTVLHAQNGAGGGPPAPNQAGVQHLTVPPALPSGELLLAGPLAALLLAVAVVTAFRRRAPRGASWKSADGDLNPG